jgi:hypothetical protein
MTSLLTRALISGAGAAATTMITAAITGRTASGSYAAPINATSHIIWGENAARQNSPSLKYTGSGALLNYGGAVFWALFYEALQTKSRARGSALLRSGIISVAAYVTDYHLVSKRFTPGFEKRLSGGFLALIYGAFGIGLCIRDLLPKNMLKIGITRTRSRKRSTLSAHKHRPTVH